MRNEVLAARFAGVLFGSALTAAAVYVGHRTGLVAGAVLWGAIVAALLLQGIRRARS